MGTAWVLDPVGVGGLPWRTDLAAVLLEHRPTAIRGNAAETATTGLGGDGRGMDSGAADATVTLVRSTDFAVHTIMTLMSQLSQSCGIVEHVSERVGRVEREMLERARACLVARNVEHFRLLGRIAELDRAGVAEQTGDRLVECLVQDLARCERREATRLVDESRDLVPRVGLCGESLPPRLPHASAALAAGAISEAHVAVLRRAMRRLEDLRHLEPATVAEAEESLADKARTLPPRGLGKAADRLLALLDPDGAAPDPGEGRSDGVELLRRRDGSLDLRATIADAAAAAMIDEGFDVMSQPAGPDDDRDLRARRADALKELFATANGPGGLITDTRHERSSDGDGDGDGDGDEVGSEPAGTEPTDAEPDDQPTGTEANPAEPAGAEPNPAESGGVQEALIPAPRRPDPTESTETTETTGPARRRATTAPRSPAAGAGRALLTITIDHQWLRRSTGYGTLDNEALTDVDTVRRWACDADIIPMVLGSTSEPLDIGRRTRAVPEAIRRALNLRDGGCAFPGCTRRPRRCHAHHVDHWIDGGPTALHNLTLLCVHHHQLVHHGNWRVEMINGQPWFTPPTWVDPQRRPRPGGRYPVRT